jgi:hypothetical protein
MAATRNQLAAADDAQRMLLTCVLLDALNRDYRITDACPACRAIDYLCVTHWDEHDTRRTEYQTLRDYLESYEGSDAVCPLTAHHRQVIAMAVDAAITYRRRRNRPEDTALLAAYRSLRHRLRAGRWLRAVPPAPARPSPRGRLVSPRA